MLELVWLQRMERYFRSVTHKIARIDELLPGVTLRSHRDAREAAPGKVRRTLSSYRRHGRQPSAPRPPPDAYDEYVLPHDLLDRRRVAAPVLGTELRAHLPAISMDPRLSDRELIPDHNQLSPG